MLYVPSAGNSMQRGTTVETTVELVAPMAAEGARHQTLVRLAIPSDQREDFRLSHRRRPPMTSLRIVERQLHADTLATAYAADGMLEIDSVKAFGSLERALGRADDGCVAELER